MLTLSTSMTSQNKFAHFPVTANDIQKLRFVAFYTALGSQHCSLKLFFSCYGIYYLPFLAILRQLYSTHTCNKTYFAWLLCT